MLEASCLNPAQCWFEKGFFQNDGLLYQKLRQYILCSWLNKPAIFLSALFILDRKFIEERNIIPTGVALGDWERFMQEKFLLAVAAVIVTLAVMAGVQMFEKSLKQTELNEVSQDLLAVVCRAQTWYRRPAGLGGGNGSFAKLTFAAIACDSVNRNGVYTLSKRQKSSFYMTAAGNVGPGDDGWYRMTLQVFPDSVSVLEIKP